MFLFETKISWEKQLWHQDWDQEEEEEEDTHQARDWWEERFHPAEVRAMSTLGASLFYYDVSAL